MEPILQISEAILAELEQTFGNFETQTDGGEYLLISFSPTSLPLRQRWRNSGLSADFLAEYWTAFFPAHDVPTKKRQREISGAINYIANELLENVMKFNYQAVEHDVSLGLYLYQDEFRFYANNAIDPAAVEDFQQRIRFILKQDAENLYLQQVEKNVSENRSSSQLGLLTMIHDYGAELAWKFEKKDSALMVVTTMVRLSL